MEIQKLRCRVNYSALKFTPQIEELGKRVVKLLRKNGPFLVLHLRYEMDMLAFSGCTQGCNSEEVEELTKMRWCLLTYLLIYLFIFQTKIRLFGNFFLIPILSHFRYAYPWWKEKVIDSEQKRKDGLCPLTPEDTALTLRALDIDPNFQIYIAAGEIYGGKRRMQSLAKAYPKLVCRLVIQQFLYPMNYIMSSCPYKLSLLLVK